MTNIECHNNMLVVKQGYETVQIESWGQDSLRVRATKGSEIRDDLPGALLKPEPVGVVCTLTDNGAILRNGAIAADISTQGVIRFLETTRQTELLSEYPQHHFRLIPARYFKPMGSETFHIEVQFSAYENEHLYGLGQRQHGLLDQKGCTLDLFQINTSVNIPFLLSNRGYGFLWNNPSTGRVQLGRDATRWVAESTHQLDYWITAGDTPAAILERYAEATGHVPELPSWAAGFWQSKLRYESEEELLSVAREYKRRGLPLSVIVVDFFHWTVQGDWQFDHEKWPDPSGMVRELDAISVKLMVSVWPTVNALSANYAKMQEQGLLLQTSHDMPAHTSFRDNHPEGPVNVYLYDPTNPEARDYIWQKVRAGYYQHGIKVWWLDACEPELVPFHIDHLRYHLGDGRTVGNLYPLMHARAFYEGMCAEKEDEIVLLARSAWAGNQRFGTAVWSGDIPSTFEALQAQVPAGLNIALSGIPWWTTDIGGFFGGEIASQYFRELIVRWFQYGVFCPIFRLHGVRNPRTLNCGADNEVWSFGDEAYDIIRELLFLRERLRPYIMAQMHLAHTKGTPPMRPLFFDFPQDAASWPVEDQFMFGPDLLVAPVLHNGERNRQVYFPQGAAWTNAWTGQRFEGGQTLYVDAPLDTIPLYLRDDAQLPIKSK